MTSRLLPHRRLAVLAGTVALLAAAGFGARAANATTEPPADTTAGTEAADTTARYGSHGFRGTRRCRSH